jgi:hypothetical protein
MSPPQTSKDTVRTVRPPAQTRGQATVAAAALLCAASMLVLGFWAFFAPASFSDFIAYAPYNRHLVHDAGAFQVGIGAAVFLAVFWRDSVLVALTGFAVASALHTVSHTLDRHIGGHASDVPALGLLTLVALTAMYLRFRGRAR